MRKLAGLLIIALFLVFGVVSFVSEVRDDGAAGSPSQEEPDTPAQNEPDAPASKEPDTPQPSEPEAPSQEEPTGEWDDIDPQDPFLLLVNKTHPIDPDYKPWDLTEVKYFAKDREKITRYMRKEVTEAFHQLVEAAAEEGHTIVMTTAYRSYGVQKTLYEKYVANHGQAAANQYSAKPGQSEHQTGLCADVSSPSVGYKLVVKYGQTPEGKWLAAHAHEYGFILRFPEGKEDITGYHYEPWHIRYVGQPAANRIYENDLTLEEYLGAVAP